MTEDNFWFKNPYILWDTEKLHMFCPSAQFSYEENMNALMRFAIYISLIMFAFGLDYRAFYVVVVFGIISYFLWKTRKNGNLANHKDHSPDEKKLSQFHDKHENSNNVEGFISSPHHHDHHHDLNIPLTTVEKRCASMDNPLGNPAPGDTPKKYGLEVCQSALKNHNGIILNGHEKTKERQLIEQSGLLINHYSDIEAEYPKGTLQNMMRHPKNTNKTLLELANGNLSYFGRQFYTVPGNGIQADIPQFGEFLFSKTKRGRNPTLYRLGM